MKPSGEAMNTKRQHELEKYFHENLGCDPCDCGYFEGGACDADGEPLSDADTILLEEWEVVAQIALPRRWYEPNYDAKTASETQEEANHVYLTLK